MRLTLCCIWLLLVLICCWQCMAMPRHAEKKPAAHGSHSHSHSHSHSKENESHGKNHESHSKEHKSSKEKDSSSEERSSSKEKGSDCMNRKQDKEETDVDCGGKKCSPCADNKKCLVNRDCMSESCKDHKCIPRPTKMPSTTATRSTTTSITTITHTVTTTTEAPVTSEEVVVTEQPATETPTTSEKVVVTEQPATEAPATTDEVLVTEAPATPEEVTQTESPATTEEEVVITEQPTTREEFVATEEPTIMQFTCHPECQNGGACTINNTCICSSDFSGATCEVQSTGLCLDEETFDAEPILEVTFGKGSSQFSRASPAQFNFTTTYTQRREPTIDDGYFTFINSIYNHHDAWHTGAQDHTGDEGGYMYLVNANFEPGQFYSGRVDNLCVGLRYEFSVYLANVCKKAGRIDPNVLFEVRSVDGNELLAQLNSGNVPERDTLTWEKYGFSFIATNSSVNLLMISNTRGGSGNDIVIDDIALRVCAHKGSGFCPSK